jgi:NAD(P)-dependent dehydrogenase (short-subunit alcohol dehydrogenase family)
MTCASRLGELADWALDQAVLPGYTRIGYVLRERLVERGPIDLAGKTVVVTGASSGIGEAAATGLARGGARVLLAVRNRERGELALQRILAAVPNAELELVICDISSLASVRHAAARLLASQPKIDVLVNNAGILPASRIHTEEGFELTFATNVLGPFLLTAALLPALTAAAVSPPARVINVSSGGMYTARLDLQDPQLEKREFNGARFYAHSKRLEVALTDEWAKRLAPRQIVVHSTHPGWVATPGISGSLPAFDKLMRPLLRSPDAGADTIVWLAGSPKGAENSGAFWHDRKPRPKHRLFTTRETAAERVALFDRCAELCGLDPATLTAQ